MSEHFFGEWVEYRSEEEKIEAKQYLDLWKKFFMRKIPDLEFVNEQIIDRKNIAPISLGGLLLGEPISTLAIKICMKGEKLDNVKGIIE
jgi:hypothetical protein|tara:strand:+ start:953 stop:1219 length:267 start_codon:yes stop_codon:yes gene_type:complete